MYHKSLKHLSYLQVIKIKNMDLLKGETSHSVHYINPAHLSTKPPLLLLSQGNFDGQHC